MSNIRNYLNSLIDVVSSLPEKEIRDVLDILRVAYDEDRQVFLIGNGGSAATASHVACDLQKGVKEQTGRRFRVQSLADSVPIMTAWANDTHYERIYAEQLDSLLEPGDVVVAVSGSGNSPNIIQAIQRANEMSAITVAWTGFSGGKLARIAQKSIIARCDNMQRIEDVHMIIGHLLYSCLIQEVTEKSLAAK